MQQKYWLRDWMHEHDVKSMRDARKALADDTALKRLQQYAHAAEAQQTVGVAANAVVAGRGIDLSNDLECPHWDCKRKQVDRLFGWVWHYFDQIAVTVASPLRYSKPEAVGASLNVLEGHLQMLLYLREIGAEDLLVFVQKPPECEVHALQHLREAGLDIDDAEEERLARDLLLQAKLSTFQHEDHLHYMFTHPMFEHSVDGALEPGFDMNHPDFGHRVARAVVRRYAAHLASDIRAATDVGAPLGCVLGFHSVLLARRSAQAAPDDVALRLSLPVLDGLPARDIVRLRNDEHESFVKFRTALNVAMRERTKSAGSSTADVIAREIDRDVLEPALADITQRLKAAESVLAKKATLSIALSTFATTCGLMASTPLLLTAGVALAATAVGAEAKYVEERRDVQLSDMYFLGKALHERHGAA